jgi:type IV secretory pathway VirB10-like protein
MRKTKIEAFLPSFLCAAALFAAACDRGADRTPAPASQVAQSQAAPASPQAPPPPVNELQPPPQSVRVPPPAPPAAAPSLDARERDLAARAAALDARERRLREREQPKKSAEARRPSPAPAPPSVAEPAAPAPEPAAEPALSPEPSPVPEPAPPAPPKITTVIVPAGTYLAAELTKTLASDTSKVGETFRARIGQDVTQDDGLVVIPAGSEVVGEVTAATPGKKIGGQARLTLKITDLVLPTGKTVPIDATIVQEGRGKGGRDAATIGGAAAGGAVLGRILGGADRGKGGVIGALIGAAAGAVIAAHTPAEQVVVPQGTALGLRLDQPVEVRVVTGGGPEGN